MMVRTYDRKKCMVCFGFIIIFTMLVVLKIGKKENEEISVWQEGSFSFASLDFDVTEEVFLQEQKDCILIENAQEIEGAEHIYNKTFFSETFGREVQVYYYFTENLFEKGIYEICYEEEERNQFFDEVVGWLETEGVTEVEIEKKEIVTSRWKSWLDSNRELILVDGSNHVCFLYVYNEKHEEDAEHIFAIEIYQGTEQRAWPENIQECWNVEKDSDFTKSEQLYYAENKVDLVDFFADSISVIDVESREKSTISLSDDLVIWAQLNPAAYGEVSYDLLVEVEKSAGKRIWCMGFNEQGEVEHLYECLLP